MGAGREQGLKPKTPPCGGLRDWLTPKPLLQQTLLPCEASKAEAASRG